MSKKNAKRKFEKFLVTFSRILASMTIIGVILVLIPLSIPRFLGYETYNVISGSMEPEIPVGSLILVKRTDPHDVQEGEIIAFYSNAVVVSHRVVKNNTFSNKFVTKGDANDDVDLTDPEYKDFIGTVVYHIPMFGAFGEYLSTPSGKLFLGELILVAGLMFVISDKIKV